MFSQLKEKRTQIIFGLGTVSLLCLPVAGLGSRFGLWHTKAGMSLLMVGVGLAAIAVVAAIFTHLKPWRPSLANASDYLFALIPALIVLAIIGRYVVLFTGLPVIHNISTDTNNPPQFVHVVPLRGKDSNPVSYRHKDNSKDLASMQRAAYPDVKTLTSDLPNARAFTKALEIARDNMGWEIVNADPITGFIEATATSFWFGFKDDVVIRVQPQNGGSHVDLRSVSRVGEADLGANAARIRAFSHHWREN